MPRPGHQQRVTGSTAPGLAAFAGLITWLSLSPAVQAQSGCSIQEVRGGKRVPD